MIPSTRECVDVRMRETLLIAKNLRICNGVSFYDVQLHLRPGPDFVNFRRAHIYFVFCSLCVTTSILHHRERRSIATKFRSGAGLLRLRWLSCKGSHKPDSEEPALSCQFFVLSRSPPTCRTWARRLSS